MAVDVTVDTVIDSPPEAVAAYAGDPTNAPEWYANIRSVEWQTPAPVTVGSRMDFLAQFLTYTWEPTGGGRTRMTLRNRGNPSGFARLTAPVVERAMRRATTKDLLRLKTIVESHDVS